VKQHAIQFSTGELEVMRQTFQTSAQDDGQLHTLTILSLQQVSETHWIEGWAPQPE
jgi:hypothetical protein